MRLSKRLGILTVTLLSLLAVTSALHASGFEVEKQKLKLSLEYENFLGTRSEVSTTGLKATYLLKAKGNIAGKAFLNFDFQTRAKRNFARDFIGGELSPLIWSNRMTTSVTVPVKDFYVGGSFYFRNKWLAGVESGKQFIDLFGGQGFREMTGSIRAGYVLSPRWEISASAQKSDLTFAQFPLSNSQWQGVSIRLTHKIRDIKVNVDYRIRNVDYNRPVFSIFPVVVVDPFSFPLPEQKDRFSEVGANIEFFNHVYFSGGYSYQNNDSNNPGFGYKNHRINVLIGTELTGDIHLQAYGIIQRQDFLGGNAELEFPVLLEESENNTMAASLIKTLGNSREIEFGFQRLTNNSSFSQLDLSKYILYVAYNYRF